jgi:hypothetical protein
VPTENNSYEKGSRHEILEQPSHLLQKMGLQLDFSQQTFGPVASTLPLDQWLRHSKISFKYLFEGERIFPQNDISAVFDLEWYTIYSELSRIIWNGDVLTLWKLIVVCSYTVSCLCLQSIVKGSHFCCDCGQYKQLFHEEQLYIMTGVGVWTHRPSIGASDVSILWAV